MATRPLFRKAGFFFLFSPANLTPTSALCRCRRRAVTFTLPLTSWLGDGQLDGRAAGVRARAERRGGSIQAASSIWDLMIMNAIRARACTKQETKPRCGVHHLLPFTCPRSMEATRRCSHPENLSVRPAGRGEEANKKRRGQAKSQATPQEQFHFLASLIPGCVIVGVPKAFLSALLQLPISLASCNRGSRGET